MDRRKFIEISSMTATMFTLPDLQSNLINKDRKIKAILFDAFPVFNPSSVFNLAIKFFPDKGQDLIKEWKTKQFEYTWLRSMSNSYVDFITITDNSLMYAAQLLNISMNEIQRKQLVDAYYQLEAWPEVSKVVKDLKSNGYRLGILSNFTPGMLLKNVKNCHLENEFEHLLSVDQVRKYKPASECYQMGVDTFKLSKTEILFVAFAGWDAAGAKQFGYKTFWVNRLKIPLEMLGTSPDGEGNNLNDLKMFCENL